MTKTISIKRLKKEGNWCFYRGGRKPDGGINKRPFSPKTLMAADNSNCESFGSYQLAMQRKKDHAIKNPKHDPGIGIHLGELGDGCFLIGIDCDGCVDLVTGEIAAWAQDIANKFWSYTEISPSGTGIKIFSDCVQERPADATLKDGHQAQERVQAVQPRWFRTAFIEQLFHCHI